jgi:hypothetical protein
MPDYGFNRADTRQEYCLHDGTANANDGLFTDDIRAPANHMAVIHVPQPLVDQTQYCTSLMSTLDLRQSLEYTDFPECGDAQPFTKDMGPMQHTRLAVPAQIVPTSRPIMLPTQSPWSDFNLRENAVGTIPTSEADGMIEPEGVSEASRSNDAGNVFSPLDEDGMNSLSSFCWDVNYTTDINRVGHDMMPVHPEGGADQGTQWLNASKYAYGQEHGHSHSINIPIIMHEDIPFLGEDGRRSNPVGEISS